MEKKIEKEIKNLKAARSRLHEMSDGSGNSSLLTAYFNLSDIILMLEEAARHEGRKTQPPITDALGAAANGTGLVDMG